MKVTEVKFITVEPKDIGVCAEAVVVVDDAMCIHHIRVIKGKNGLFVAFPNSGYIKTDDGKKQYKDIVHPRTHSLRASFESAVLKAYDDTVQEHKANKSGVTKSAQKNK